MKKIIYFVLFLSLLIPTTVFAYQPNFVRSQTQIEISEPEISKVYYGFANDRLIVYKINSDQEFTLYLNLLVPKLDNISTKISSDIFYNAEKIATLDGYNFDWTIYHEKFSNDEYLKGPEFEKIVPAGFYEIVINPDPSVTKYVLVVGKVESFSPAVIWKTLNLLPDIKREFFNKPPISAYFNLIGLFIFGALILFQILIILIIWLIIRRHKVKVLEKIDQG